MFKYKSKEEVAEILSRYFSLCRAIVTDDSPDYKKHVLLYQAYRQQILELKRQVRIPSWIFSCTNISILKSHIDMHVQGGTGSWSRRRNYLQAEMESILLTYLNPETNNVHYSTGDNHPNGNIQGNFIHRLVEPTSSNIRKEQLKMGISNAGSPDVERKKKVFIVHGHDELLKNEVYVFLNQEGYEPIILQLQASKGSTIIEKLEENIEGVSFAVILYTGCDEGKSVKETDFKYRARQNVVFEHGYLLCKLGRERVAALKKDDVEIPGDLQGLITISTSNWKYELLKEMKAVK